MKKKLVIICLVILLLTTGCTKTLKGEDNKAVTNSETGQNLTANILCQPTEEHFNGWFLDKNYENPIDFDTYEVKSDITLYGKWSSEETKQDEVEEETTEEVETTTTKKKKSKKTTTTTTTTKASNKVYVVSFDTAGHSKIESQKVKENEHITEPTVSKTLYETYQENENQMEVKLEDLPKCSEMKIYDKNNYNGLWVQIFVRPLALAIIKLGAWLNNYGLSVMILGLVIRLILLPFSAKTVKQSESMKKAQPEIEKIEKKYAGKDDQQSMMAKSQETLAVYQKYHVNPMTSCLVSFIQLPLFFAFLEAINRVPAIFENYFWKFQLGTTPLVGIKEGNYLYLILIALILLFTALSFMMSMSSMSGNSEQMQQSKFMMIFMTVFIGIASIQLPAAIALYWIVSNMFTVFQTLILKKIGGKKNEY